MYALGGGEEGLDIVPIFHLYWTQKPAAGDLAQWPPQVSTIPNYYQAGLSSLLATNMQVKLYTHSSELHGLPASTMLEVLDAAEYTSVEEARDWIEHGFQVQHVNDIVRMGSVVAHGGFMADGDLLLLRLPQKTPSKTGNLFASLHAKKGGCIAGPERFWRKEYLTEPLDHLWLSMPMHLPRESSLAREILMAWRQCCSNRVEAGVTTTVGYNIFMDQVKALVWHHGLELDVLPPSAFSPVPQWLQRQVFKADFLKCPLVADGHPIQSASDILEYSFGLPQLWASTKPAKMPSAQQANKVPYPKVENGSLLGRIYRQLGICIASGGMLPSSLFEGVVRLQPAAQTHPIITPMLSVPCTLHPIITPTRRMRCKTATFLCEQPALGRSSLPVDLLHSLFSQGDGAPLNTWEDCLAFAAVSKRCLVMLGPVAVERTQATCKVEHALCSTVRRLFREAFTKHACNSVYQWGKR